MLSRSTIFLGLMLTGSLALASLVRDEPPSTEVVLPAPRASNISSSDDRPADLPALQLDKLARGEIADPEHNPFAGKSWFVSRSLPPVISTLKEVERPSTPSVPFRYMGRIQEEGGRPVVFFTQGSQAYAVSEGEDIDDSYHLESVSPTKLELVYLPLKTKQTLNVGSLEMEPDEGSDEVPSDVEPNALSGDSGVGEIAGSGRQ